MRRAIKWMGRSAISCRGDSSESLWCCAKLYNELQLQNKLKALVSNLSKPNHFQSVGDRWVIVGRDDLNSQTLTLCRHRFPPQNGSVLPPSAESPVAPATESQSPTTRDTIRLIVRGSLGSCSSSSECECASFSQRDPWSDWTSWSLFFRVSWMLTCCCCFYRPGRQHDRERGRDCCKCVEGMSGEHA